jgi:uncharacterized protein YndB with AHSA1/START domain
VIDLLAELAAIHREVAADADDTVRVTVARSYPTTPADLWEAITDPERTKRWFLPLSGDLRVGGQFQLEGNAGGDILACEPPTLLRVTFGDVTSVVEVRLRATGDEETHLELRHRVPLALAGSVDGAMFVGHGWDGALLMLARHTRDDDVADPLAYADSPEVIEFNRGSIDEWTTAVERAGTATADQVAQGREMSLAQFVPAG